VLNHSSGILQIALISYITEYSKLNQSFVTQTSKLTHTEMSKCCIWCVTVTHWYHGDHSGGMNMVTIQSEAQLDEVLGSHAGEDLVIFKHSTQCPISAAAYDEVVKFEKGSNAPVYMIRAIEERPVSNYFASTYGVKHESPQAIVLRDGKVRWHASHWNITEQALQGALA
jgi:bacillithiol system protein YtxJ